MKIWKERDEKLKVWIHRADFTCRGKRYKPKAYSKEELERTVIQIKSAALKVKAGLPADVPAITLGELVAEHTRDFDLSIEYYRRGKVVVEMFRDFIGEDEPVESIKAADLRGFVRSRQQQNPDLKNSSINKDLTYLSKLFSSGREYFRELDEFTPPKMPWLQESTKRKDRVIYEEEAKTLLDYLRDPEIHKGEKPDSPTVRGNYADMFELAMNTAMRWGEVARLEWSMINLSAGIAVLPPRITKIKEPRTVPLNSRAKEILASRSGDSIFVFPRGDGKAPMLYYADRIGAIAKKLGLPFGREAGFTLHLTRHSAVSGLIENGVDIATVQQISGHKSRTIALHYAHANKTKLHSAVESLVQKSSTKKRTRSDGR